MLISCSQVAVPKFDQMYLNINLSRIIDFDVLNVVHFFLVSKLSLVDDVSKMKTFIDDLGKRFVKSDTLYIFTFVV